MNRHKHHRTRQYGGRGDDEYGGWRGRDEDGEEDGYGGRGDNERWEDGGYEPEADQTVEARPTEDPRPVDDLPIATEQTEKAQTSQRQATTANSPASAQNSPSTSSTLSLTSSASPSPATARPSSLSTFHDLDIDDPSSSTTSRRMAASNNLTSSSGPTQVATVTQQTGFSATSDEGTLGVSAYGDGDYSIEADSSATSMSRNSDLSDTLSQSSTSSSTSTAATVEALPQVNEDKSVNGAMVAGSIIGAVLLLVGLGLLFFRKWKKRKASAAADDRSSVDGKAWLNKPMVEDKEEFQETRHSLAPSDIDSIASEDSAVSFADKTTQRFSVMRDSAGLRQQMWESDGSTSIARTGMI